MKSKTKNRLILALVLYAITLTINFLGAFGFINGMTQKAVSDKYPTLITPAPIAFGIWGLIYISIILSFIILLRFYRTNHSQEATTSISVLFYITCVLNIFWIITFSYEMLLLSSIITLSLAMTNAKICMNISSLKISILKVPYFAFGLYTGWTMMATVLNISALLVKLNWSIFTSIPVFWTILTLAVSMGLTAFVAYMVNNAIIPLPVSWALFQIWLIHRSPNGFNAGYPIIMWVSIIGTVLMILFCGFLFRRNKDISKPQI